MMLVYNEEDILRETIEHNISQGLDVVILDNGSSDGTFEYCSKLAQENRIRLAQMKTRKFSPELLFRALYDVAIMSQPDWVVLVSADEFLESYPKDRRLIDEIMEAEQAGYNLLQADRFDFFMTDVDHETLDEKSERPSIRTRLRHYSYHGDALYRAWRFIPGTTIGPGGHRPIFPEDVKYRISPKKLVLCHFPYRDPVQSRARLESRLDRRMTDPNQPPNQYQRASNFESLVFDHTNFSQYGNSDGWNCRVKRFIPFANPNPPSRDEIFTADGGLKKRPDLRARLRSQEIEIEELRSKLQSANQRIEELTSENNDKISQDNPNAD